MSDDLAERIADFLDRHHVMSLATAGPAPHAANLFYARDGLALIWVSDPASRHSRQLAAAPDIAATVAPDYADFPAIRGLQIQGRAAAVADPAEHDRLLGLLKARYPFLKRLDAAPPDLRAAAARARVYRLAPARIVLIDNSRGFGHKDTLDLAAANSE